MKNTVTELLNNAPSNIINYEFFQSEYGPEINKYDEDDTIEFKNSMNEAGIVVEHAEQHGGEGEGDQYWSVYKFTKGDDSVFVKFKGWYASYVGSEFNEWFFVEPKQKTITVYEA